MSPSLSLPLAPADDATLLAALERTAAAHTALATRLLGNAEDGRDAVQEAWLRAWRHRSGVREVAALEGWVRVIVVRECHRALRRRALRRWLPFGAPPVDPVDPGPAVDTRLSDARRMRALRHHVEALPPRQRLAWGLRFDEGWTVAEIAAAMDTSAETVKTHLDRALTTLHRRLGAPHVL